jgi:L-threonylcarbamoyladenylate synthase
MQSKSLSWNNKKDRELLVKILQAGGIALGSSDTVIGLLTSATLQAREKLDAIKQRAEKPYIVLIGSLDKLQHYVETPDSLSVQNIMNNCWPGPVTLIFKARENSLLPQKTIAVRIPLHKGLLDVLQHCDGLLSTSANKAGLPVPATIHEVDAQILQQVDCTITDDQAQKEEILPSTILNCTGDQIVVVREGAYKIADLERIAGTKLIKS